MAQITVLPPREVSEAEEHMQKRVLEFMQCVSTINRLGRQVGRTSLASDFMMSLNALVMFADNPEFEKIINVREAAKNEQ